MSAPQEKDGNQVKLLFLHFTDNDKKQNCANNRQRIINTVLQESSTCCQIYTFAMLMQFIDCLSRTKNEMWSSGFRWTAMTHESWCMCYRPVPMIGHTRTYASLVKCTYFLRFNLTINANSEQFLSPWFRLTQSTISLVFRSPSWFHKRDNVASIRVSLASVVVCGNWTADTLRPVL